MGHSVRGPRKILKYQDGFSLIELLVVMAIFVIVLAISADTFTIIMKQSSQQAKASETQIERIVGIELLRVDLESAGSGLPWSFQNSINYQEAASAPAGNYNDSPSNVPRAIVTGNNTGTNGSDYLVIKSTAVATSNTAQRYSYIANGSTIPKAWGNNDLSTGDRVIVITPQAGETNLRQLAMDSGSFFTQYKTSGFAANFIPANPGEINLIYGVDPDTDLIMPFNRADYFISTSSVPSYCAPNTGVLEKVVVSQSDGSVTNYLPLLDCVADFQVVFQTDTDGNGTIDNQAATLDGLTAQQVREQVKEIRVYILSHEGQKDTSFAYPNPIITIGDFGLGSAFNLSTKIGSGYRNYRWKVTTLIVQPKNLM